MLEKIKEITADSLGADVNTLTAETSFKEDLGADSLDLFEMVMALEEEFEVEIPTEDLENIKTIGCGSIPSEPPVIILRQYDGYLIFDVLVTEWRFL